MNCLDVDSLIRYVHGEENAPEAEAIQPHLAACLRCREEVASISALEKSLRRLVEGREETARAGSGCLGADLFAAYLEGSLPEAERESVEGHLAGCAECRDEVAVSLDRLSVVAQSLRSTPAHLLARAMELEKAPRVKSPQTEEETDLLEIVVRSVQGLLELVWTSGQLVLAPPALPIRRARNRAETRTLEVEKKMGRFSVAVEMEQVDDSLCQLIVRVKKGVKPTDGIRVSLISGIREQASFVTRRGEVLFDRVPFGAYHLTIFEAGFPVGKIRLRVEGNRHE
jgi:anti-sigma factor RsiW